LEAGEDCTMRNFIICRLHQILLRDQINGARWVGHVARMGEMRNCYTILVGKPEGKRPLGKPRRRREDNIRMRNKVRICVLNSFGLG